MLFSVLTNLPRRLRLSREENSKHFRLGSREGECTVDVNVRCTHRRARWTVPSPDSHRIHPAALVVVLLPPHPLQSTSPPPPYSSASSATTVPAAPILFVLLCSSSSCSGLIHCTRLLPIHLHRRPQLLFYRLPREWLWCGNDERASPQSTTTHVNN